VAQNLQGRSIRTVHPNRLTAAALAAAASVALTAPGAASAAKAPAKAGKAAKPDVTVMSRNLYLGADIITAALASDRADLERRATELFGVVQQTNFPVRARAIAAEIRATRPDLIGLQEVALWRRTPQGVTNDRTDAKIVVYDFLALLQKQLKARGMSYRPAVVQHEADLEVPTSKGFDVRLTMRDVILVRTGKGAKVRVRRTLKGHYRDVLTVPIPTGNVRSVRGWTAADVTIAGRPVRFVNTHLEAYGGDIRANQAKQLLAGPLKSRMSQTILVGDLNSDTRDPAPDSLAIDAFLTAGFVDAFRTPPATSGQSEKLDNRVSTLKSYIDHIMSRPALKTIRTRVVGNKPSDRIRGLWPSDHAGTVATLRLRR
jgi:endonuclease/exonuclease/phosphatase family metal-dependent hydrolase